MGSAVTITPDASSDAPVSITPDPPKRTWLDSAADFGKELWNQVNPVAGVKGAAEMAAHPISTYVADASNRQKILDKAEQDFKSGDYTSGMAHALYGIVPFLGPNLERMGEQAQQGQYAAAAGGATGLGLSLAAPEVVKNLNVSLPAGAPKLAERMYQSALKPSTTLRPGVVASRVQTGLEAGIPVSEAGVEKLGSLMDNLQDSIKADIQSGAQAGTTVNKFKVASRLGDTYQDVTSQVNPVKGQQAVARSGNEFLANQPAEIPIEQAQDLKQGTYQQIKKSYGQMSDATKESQKALARGLKEEIANAFPEIAGLNAQESKFIGLDQSLERAVSRISNHQLLGIGTPLAAAGGKAVTGSTSLAGVAAILKSVVDDPVMKSKLAIALNRAAKGGIGLNAAAARIAAYSDALGNAANAQPPENQGNAQTPQ